MRKRFKLEGVENTAASIVEYILSGGSVPNPDLDSFYAKVKADVVNTIKDLLNPFEALIEESSFSILDKLIYDNIHIGTSVELEACLGNAQVYSSRVMEEYKAELIDSKNRLKELGYEVDESTDLVEMTCCAFEEQGAIIDVPYSFRSFLQYRVNHLFSDSLNLSNFCFSVPAKFPNGKDQIDNFTVSIVPDFSEYGLSEFYLASLAFPLSKEAELEMNA